MGRCIMIYLSVLYEFITKSSAKYLLLDVPSWTQNSYLLDTSPPSELAQMSVFPAERKLVTWFSSASSSAR